MKVSHLSLENSWHCMLYVMYLVGLEIGMLVYVVHFVFLTAVIRLLGYFLCGRCVCVVAFLLGIPRL